MNQADENVIKALKEKLIDLEAEKIAFLETISSKISSIQNTLAIFSPSPESKIVSDLSPNTEKFVDFIKPRLTNAIMAFTLIDTVLYTVKNDIDKFETSSSIAKLINNKYGLEKSGENMNKFITQVSSLLSKWKQKGVICSYQYSNSKKDNVWGRLEWLKEDGIPKEGFFERPSRNWG